MAEGKAPTPDPGDPTSDLRTEGDQHPAEHEHEERSDRSEQATPAHDNEHDNHDEQGDRGALDVRQRVLTRMAEHTAALVPGSVRHSTGLGRLAGRGYPSASATVRGRTSRIELDVAAIWPCNVHELAHTVRDRVRTETGRLSGTRVTSVDVTVHLVDPADATPTRRVE